MRWMRRGLRLRWGEVRREECGIHATSPPPERFALHMGNIAEAIFHGGRLRQQKVSPQMTDEGSGAPGVSGIPYHLISLTSFDSEKAACSLPPSKGEALARPETACCSMSSGIRWKSSISVTGEVTVQDLMVFLYFKSVCAHAARAPPFFRREKRGQKRA